MPQVNKMLSDDGRTTFIRFRITTAEVVAIGAATSGQIALGFTIPANAQIRRAFVKNSGAVAATLATLTASLGTAGGSYTDIIAANTVHAANATSEDLAATKRLTVAAASTEIKVEFVGNADLGNLTGAANGFDGYVEYHEPKNY